MGLTEAPPVIKNEEIILKQLPSSARKCSTIVFTVVMAEGVEVVWRCRMLNFNLYVDVPASLGVYGSKDR